MLKFGSKHDNNIVYKCTVRLLEDTEILECEYKPQSKGKYLLEYVCQELNLVEQDYLGLRYMDNHGQRHWLDLGKSIYKQVKDLEIVLFSFRVKFYPPDPFRLKEDITRYQIFLQLKRDLLHGRLYCSNNEAAMLTALIVQGELGDYNSEINENNYISNLKILLKQTEPIEEKAIQIHQKQLKGHDQSEVERSFLKLACQLDTYGIDPHPVKDHKGTQLYLGVNFRGILTFQGSNKIHHFKWSDIQKINYEGKMFIIHLNYNDRKHTVGFKCPTSAACKHIWRCAMEQMLFFTLPTSSAAPAVVSGGGLFSWGTKFKYVGRTEREILEDNESPSRRESISQGSSNIRKKASSVPVTPSTPLQSHLGYSSLPRSSHSDIGGSRLECSSSTLELDGNASQFYSDVTALETVSEDQEAISGNKLRTTELKDDSIDRCSDYYFHDSFDHSSSESQLIDSSYRCDTINTSHRSSRSQTPVSHSHIENRTYLSANAQIIHTSSKNGFSPILRTLFVVIMIIFIGVITLFECNFSFLNNIQTIPEIVTLRRYIYEPIKSYFHAKVSFFN